MTTQVEQIERRLAELRRELTGDDGGRLAQRTAAMTLVAVLPSDEHLSEVCAAIRALGNRHPVRSIVLAPDADGRGPALRAEIGAACGDLSRQDDLGVAGPLIAAVRAEARGDAGTAAGVSDDRRDASPDAVCQEEVVIRWRDASPGRLLSVVGPLLLPDVPVHVWWMDDAPVGDAMFHGLVANADRLLVDTGSMREPWTTLLLLDAIQDDQSVPCMPSDMSWVRLTPWRDALTRLADDPEVSSFLTTLSDAAFDLEYATPQLADLEPAGQALMLTGWLGSRLEWSPKPGWHIGGGGPERRTLAMGVTCRGGPVSASARGVIRLRGQIGELDSLTLESPVGRLTAVRVPNLVRAAYQNKERIVRTATAPIAPLTLEASLREGLDRLIDDPEYQHALSFIASVVRSEEGNAWAATW